jgi:hypothetical protein
MREYKKQENLQFQRKNSFILFWEEGSKESPWHWLMTIDCFFNWSRLCIWKLLYNAAVHIPAWSRSVAWLSAVSKPFFKSGNEMPKQF